MYRVHLFLSPSLVPVTSCMHISFPSSTLSLFPCIYSRNASSFPFPFTPSTFSLIHHSLPKLTHSVIQSSQQVSFCLLSRLHSRDDVKEKGKANRRTITAS